MRYYNQTALRPVLAGYLAGFIVVGILYVYGLGIERFRPETIRDTIVSWGYWGPLLYILCNSLRPFFFFPAIILAVGGGLAFGPLLGATYLVIGTVFGASLCFAVARFLGRERLKRSWFAWAPIAELDDQVQRHGFRTMLVFRLAPVLPWDAVSFLAGLSPVRFRSYLAATVAGSVPGAIAFSYFGNALLQSLSTAVAIAAIIVVAGVCLRMLFRRANC